jgi:hypothetical protein
MPVGFAKQSAATVLVDVAVILVTPDNLLRVTQPSKDVFNSHKIRNFSGRRGNPRGKRGIVAGRETA